MIFRFFITLCLLHTAQFVRGQKAAKQALQGTVSYVSSRNVYVKFENTEEIQIQDTLYIKKEDMQEAVLIVTNKSSTSCVCSRLGTEVFKPSDVVFAFVPVRLETKKQSVPANQAVPIANQPALQGRTFPSADDPSPSAGDTAKVALPVVRPRKPVKKSRLRGRLSAASYSYLSDVSNTHRFQYTYTLNGAQLGHSKRWSVDQYIAFRHTLDQWERVQAHPTDALKVYAFAIKYDFSRLSNLAIGRKINPRISSVGVIDGLQAEKGLTPVLFLGAIAGWRPDVTDYSINVGLPQFGIYLGHVSKDPKKQQQTTLGFLEQRNHAYTDRRFLYFQHSNDLLKNLNLFCSFEADLYENVNGAVRNDPRLTNLLVSLRYKLSKNWNFSTAYDARRNVIYYETYRNFIDRLIENQTRQGLRLNINCRLNKNWNWGANANWRFQESGNNASENFNTFLTVNQIRGLGISATLSANMLKTSYLNSNIAGVNLNKSFLHGKINGELNYRYTDIHYSNSESQTQQHLVGANLGLSLNRHLFFYIYYEGTKGQPSFTSQRINGKVMHRF